MSPEDHKKSAEQLFDEGKTGEAFYHAQMGILELLMQMEICNHGTRGFCKDCFWSDFERHSPVRTRNYLS